MTHLSSPIEEIQAAIDKLTRMTSRASNGEWRFHKSSGVAAITNEIGRGIAHHVPENDADLIVALHATIDAQLQILTKALADEEKAAKHTWFNAGQLTRAGLLLARAINGGA